MNKRPTSPHLQIYRPQITSMLSIGHRFSGVILLIGILMIAEVISIAIFFPKLWDGIYHSIPNWLWMLIFMPVSAALIYHWLNGVRHLSWDRLIGLKLSTVYKTGYVVIITFCIIFTLLWAKIFSLI